MNRSLDLIEFFKSKYYEIDYLCLNINKINEKIEATRDVNDKLR